jgi:hypothetical protein
MVTIFMVNEDIARGMVCFFHQKKHSYLIVVLYMKNPPIAQVKKLPKVSPNAFFVKTNKCFTFLVKKVAQIFVIVFLYMKNPPIAQVKKLPKGSPNAFLSKQTNVSLFSKKSSPAQEFIIVLLYLRNPPIAQEGKKSPNLVTLITE